jgi:hypothetical protein
VLQGNNTVVGAIEDLKEVEAGEVERRELVASTIQNAQGAQVANVQAGQPVVVSVEGLKVGQAVQGGVRRVG